MYLGGCSDPHPIYKGTPAGTTRLLDTDEYMHIQLTPNYMLQRTAVLSNTTCRPSNPDIPNDTYALIKGEFQRNFRDRPRSAVRLSRLTISMRVLRLQFVPCQ